MQPDSVWQASTDQAGTAAARANSRLYWVNPFDTVSWRRAERYFMSRWLSSGEHAAKFSSPEL
jgi:hypothetical protein